MNTTIRNYEVLYIVDSTLTDDQIEPIIAKYADVVTSQGGEVQAAGRWDRRRLAYEVKGKREGLYILMYFTGEPAVPKELDRMMRIADDCMRHLITRVEPEHIDVSRINQQPSAEAAPAEATAPAAEAPAAEEAAAPVAEEAAVEAPVEEAPAEEVATEAPAEAPAEEAAAEATEEPATEA